LNTIGAFKNGRGAVFIQLCAFKASWL